MPRVNTVGLEVLRPPEQDGTSGGYRPRMGRRVKTVPSLSSHAGVSGRWVRVLVLPQVRRLASGYEPDERLLLDTRSGSGRTPRSRTGMYTVMGRAPYYLEPACDGGAVSGC